MSIDWGIPISEFKYYATYNLSNNSLELRDIQGIVVDTYAFPIKPAIKNANTRSPFERQLTKLKFAVEDAGRPTTFNELDFMFWLEKRESLGVSFSSSNKTIQNHESLIKCCCLTVANFTRLDYYLRDRSIFFESKYVNDCNTTAKKLMLLKSSLYDATYEYLYAYINENYNTQLTSDVTFKNLISAFYETHKTEYAQYLFLRNDILKSAKLL